MRADWSTPSADKGTELENVTVGYWAGRYWAVIKNIIAQAWKMWYTVPVKRMCFTNQKMEIK